MTSTGIGTQGRGALSPRAARVQMEEALGKLDISEEEATPLIIDDTDEGLAPKWLLTCKVLYRNLLHIQTIINALRPAWGNPKGLTFRSLGENMFAVEFDTKRDRDRVWDGSPWHISKHAVILEDFEPHIQPSELKFDRLQGDERFGVNPRSEAQMRSFRDVIADCALQEVGWHGIPFTWDNKQQGTRNVKARLDRAFVNQQFLQVFQFPKVKHIVSVESNHCFVLAELIEVELRSCRAPRQFRYENVWQSHPDYDDMIGRIWRTGSGQQGLGGLIEALTTVQTHLGSWGQREFGNMAKKVRKLQQRLERLQHASLGRGSTVKEKAVADQLREALRQEEVCIKQRSRVTWLKEGDRNTSYFQAQAAHRKRINSISSLQRSDGQFCTDPTEIKQEIFAFYQGLYQSQGGRDMGAQEAGTQDPLKVSKVSMRHSANKDVM
ncbi:hypothetical protein D1007_47118 [Hordeum vulgare]|nr:hypothetical protein D1007_47118 [Hordeum vulgare]